MAEEKPNKKGDGAKSRSVSPGAAASKGGQPRWSAADELIKRQLWTGLMSTGPDLVALSTALSPILARAITPASIRAFDASDLRRRIGDFEEENRSLRDGLAAKIEEVAQLKTNAEATGAAMQDLQRMRAKAERHDRVRHLLRRVNGLAQDALLKDKSELEVQFRAEDPTPAYVMSIDVRRSTELMLRAREPKLFAEFMVKLEAVLRETIVRDLGVFDKFTGDGILAFFPEFYSGESAGFLVAHAADECHRVFREHYRMSRHCFSPVLSDIGLGIGVDYGRVNIVQVGESLTVVGAPVVYACRLGGAPAGSTYVNQVAYEKMSEAFSAVIDFDEKSVPIKHEGEMLAYSIKLNARASSHKPSPPSWVEKMAGEAEQQSEPRPESLS